MGVSNQILEKEREEFRLQRDQIAVTLFSCKLIRCLECERVELKVLVEDEDRGLKNGCEFETGGGKESKVNSSRDDQFEMHINQVSNYSYGEAEALTDDIEVAINANTTQNYVGSRSFIQETQITSSVLGNLLDVVEVQVARVELQKLTYSSFCPPSVEQLELHLHFVDFSSGRKLHDQQLVDDIPVEKLLIHDVPVDIICTPTQVIFTNTPIPKPQVSNIIYLDSPNSVGFSYSKNMTFYSTGDLQTASETNIFLLKWFNLFPEFLSNPFYIAGESYSGIYGYMVGNGIADSKFDGNALVPFAHGIGLISDGIFEEAEDACKGNYYNPNSLTCQLMISKVESVIKDLNLYDILEPCHHSPTSKEDENANTSLPLSFKQLGVTERPLAVRKRILGRAWPLRALVRDGIVPMWPQLMENSVVPCIVSRHLELQIWPMDHSIHQFPRRYMGNLISYLEFLLTWNTGLHNMTGAYVNGGLQSPLPPTFQGTGLEFASPLSSVFVQAPAEKGFHSFMIDFLMGGVSAAVSKTAAALIERVKLLIQNQDEMIKVGRLSEPYKGISDCFSRTINDEGIIAL
ncbi:unnamed protein product [Camellia sinensis]